jgi:mutator protein MutT
MVIAAACIVWRNDERKEIGLIHRRDDYPHHLSGQWFFPGGRVEINEQPSETALRETKEECGLTVRNPELLDTYAYTEYWKEKDGRDREQRVILAVYQGVCVDDTKLTNSNETQDSRWVSLDELKDYLIGNTITSHTSKAVRSALNL